MNSSINLAKKVTFNEIINNIYYCIDTNIDMYFDKILNNIDLLINNIDIYNLDKNEIINKVLLNNGFKEFIAKIEMKIHTIMKNYNISWKSILLDIDNITKFELDKELIKEYKLNRFISEQIEKHIECLIEKHFFDRFNSRTCLVFDFMNIGQKLLSLTNLSEEDFSNRHKTDVKKRLIGIIINIRVRMKKSLKERVCNYISEQNNEFKIA